MSTSRGCHQSWSIAVGPWRSSGVKPWWTTAIKAIGTPGATRSSGHRSREATEVEEALGAVVVEAEEAHFLSPPLQQL